jgi:hypothetical protein
MSAIPAKEVERIRNEPDGRNHLFAPRANHPCGGDEACCFGMGGGT